MHVRLNGQFADSVARDLVPVEPRGRHVVQAPSPWISHRYPGGSLDRAQARRPVQFEYGHPAEYPVYLARLHPQDSIAVLDPCAAGTGETDIGQFADGLFALRKLPHRWRSVFADAEHDQGEGETGKTHRPRDAPDRYARRSGHHQFTARRQMTEPH